MSTTDRLSTRIAHLEYQLSAALTRIRQLEGSTPTGGIRRGVFKAKLDEDLAADGTADASLWHHDGTDLADLGTNVEVAYWNSTFSTGDEVFVVKMQDGKWYPIGNSTTLYSFTLTEDMGNTTPKLASCTIYTIDGTGTTEHATGQTVYDPWNVFDGALSGATGPCVKQGGKYYAVNSSCGGA